MRMKVMVWAIVGVCAVTASGLRADAGQRGGQPAAAPTIRFKTLVGRLDLETLQGDDQGADAVRRSPAGHRAQPQGGRLDRGAAQELRLPDRAHQVRTFNPPRRRRAAAARAARGAAVRRVR